MSAWSMKQMTLRTLKFSNNKGNCEKKLKLWVELSKNELEIESDR